MKNEEAISSADYDSPEANSAPRNDTRLASSSTVCREQALDEDGDEESLIKDHITSKSNFNWNERSQMNTG